MIDLHTHSTHSDGSDSPTQLIKLAVDAGLSAIALTDHDTVVGIEEGAAAAATTGLEFIAGVELSCHTSKRNVHILGHFVDHTSRTFCERLK